MLGGLRLGRVHRLVANNDGLEVISSLIDSLDKLGSKQHVSDLCALAHNRGPNRQLGMVASRSQRQIVALIAHALHDILVHNGKDKSVKSAVGDLLRVALAVGGSKLGLTAIEDVCGSLDALCGRSKALEEQGKHGFAQPHKGAKTLVESQLDVDKGDVLASGRICLELVGLLLLDHAVHRGSHALSWNRVANLDKLVAKDGRVGLHPCLCLLPVGPGTPDVDDDEKEEEGQDVHLQLEVIYRCALPHAVPCRVWSAGAHGCRSCLCRAGDGSEVWIGSWRGLRSARIVGEV